MRSSWTDEYDSEDVPTIVRTGLQQRYQDRIQGKTDNLPLGAKRARPEGKGDAMADFRLLQWARSMARENDPDHVAQTYIGWAGSLRDARVPFDALLPNDYTASVTNTLGWSGRGWGTITLDSSDLRYNCLRLTFAPWCIEPVLWKRGYHRDSSGTGSTLYTGNLPQPTPTVGGPSPFTDDIGMATIMAYNGNTLGYTEFKTAPRDLWSYANVVRHNGHHLAHTGGGVRVFDRLIGDPASRADGFDVNGAGDLLVPKQRPVNLLYGDIADSNVEHGRYQGDTPLTALGLASNTYVQNAESVPSRSYSGSVFDSLYTPFPVGQFLGGACEITVIASEGSSCSIACCGQNETRDVGCTTLTSDAQWRQNVGFPSSPEYVNDARVFLFGELENVVPGMVLVGNSFNAKQTFYIPILPNRIAFISVNLPRQHANYLMLPGFISNAYSLSSGVGTSALSSGEVLTAPITIGGTSGYGLFSGFCEDDNDNSGSRVMPQFGTGHAYSYNTWYLTNTSLFQQSKQANYTDAALGSATLNRGDPLKVPFSPFLRINTDVVGPAYNYASGAGGALPVATPAIPTSINANDVVDFPTPFQNFNVDSVNVPAKIKLDACTSNIAECIKQGMPQFEVKVASGAISIQFEFKMFYRFIVSNTHPLYLQSAVAKTHVANGAELFTTLGQIGSGMDGSEAARDYIRKASSAVMGSEITNMGAGHFGRTKASYSTKMEQPNSGIQQNAQSVVSNYDAAFTPAAKYEYAAASDAAKRGLPELAALIGRRTAEELLAELEANPRFWQSIARGGNEYGPALSERAAHGQQEARNSWQVQM